MWSDTDDTIIGGDLTVALAYLTPAGGAVVTPVAPVGMRDRYAGTVSFTTSLGFGRKLERIDRNPRVTLAFHAREHGFASDPCFVLVQGEATYESAPNPATIERVLVASERFFGPAWTGRFWDRWLRSYYRERVLVTVHAERVTSWLDPRDSEAHSVAGPPLTSAPPPSQSRPAKGTGPRIDVARATRRLLALPHVLLGYRDGDGFPRVVTVGVEPAGQAGIRLVGALPGGARRAGLLGHRFGPQNIGLETRLHTGWLSDDLYAPHTEAGFTAPANKTLTLLANGFLARRGVKRASTAASRGAPA